MKVNIIYTSTNFSISYVSLGLSKIDLYLLCMNMPGILNLFQILDCIKPCLLVHRPQDRSIEAP